VEEGQLPSGPVKIDPGDLIDSSEVAELLGLSTSRAVSTYRTRYPDFPQPVVEKASGKCTLWLRSEIEAWDRSRRRR
jgi:predicted DNA-binding transcriptional regulator AlpA